MWLTALVLAGAGLRFWGLGAVGLHGDEKTMALPVMHIVSHGTPVFPSGMFYARAIVEQYLMAGAVLVFGSSEWALRLPSALCGVLLIAMSYPAGRRFLRPVWCIAFTAAVAALQQFVADAQTARMYVFLEASVAAFVVLIFRWERGGQTWALAASVLVLAVGIQFQELAVLAAPIALFPGLAARDARKLLAAAAAIGVIGLSFVLIHVWTNGFYPASSMPAAVVHPLLSGPQAAAALPAPAAPVTAIQVGVALILGAFVAWAERRKAAARVAAALTFAGLVAQIAFYWHIGLILVAAAILAAWRAGRATARRVLVAALASLALLVVQVEWMRHAGVSLWHAVGALSGWPSFWPALALSWYSPAAAAVVMVGAVVAAINFSQRRTVPDCFLFLALAVWLPLLLIGAVAWYIPLRYAAGQSFMFLLAAFAVAQWLWDRLRTPLVPRATGESWRRALPCAVVAALMTVAVADPARLFAVYGGYSDHPDHAGAAAFVRAEHPDPHDILVAEDALVQTYYLGHVDYWLVSPAYGGAYTRKVAGRLRDIYTGSAVLDSGRLLRQLLARSDRGTVYIIGSGEDQYDGRLLARGPAIQRILTSPELQRDVVFVGRDHLTLVWKIPPPGPLAANPE